LSLEQPLHQVGLCGVLTFLRMRTEGERNG
jgi:hypothetical protein